MITKVAKGGLRNESTCYKIIIIIIIIIIIKDPNLKFFGPIGKTSQLVTELKCLIRSDQLTTQLDLVFREGKIFN